MVHNSTNVHIQRHFHVESHHSIVVFAGHETATAGRFPENVIPVIGFGGLNALAAHEVHARGHCRALPQTGVSRQREAVFASQAFGSSS